MISQFGAVQGRKKSSVKIKPQVTTMPMTMSSKQQVAVAVAMDDNDDGVQHHHALVVSSGPYSLSPVQPGDHYSESSSSLSNTDSADSLHGSAVANNQHQKTIDKNHVTNGNKQAQAPIINKQSPILIKYNYYDYNGARQEQKNHDMNFNINHQQGSAVANHMTGSGNNKVQRQLSPTFKQNLDQIVRNSQQQLHNQKSQQQQHQFNSSTTNISNKLTSPPSSPEHHQQHQTVTLARRYKLSSYEQRCLRCNKTVYQMDKVGPLKDFTFYHQNCFKCRACGTKLTLKTYFNNQETLGDQEVYCYRHCPKTGPGRLDNQSVGIRAALNAPKVFDVPPPIGQQQQLMDLGPGNQMPAGGNGQLSPINGAPNVDSRALYIQHAVKQTRLQAAYKQPVVTTATNHLQPQPPATNISDAGRAGQISQLISRRLEFLEPKQKLLEMRHREEEDALFKAFEAKWRQEESCISEQIREEWQVELAKLLAKYKRQLSNISTNQAAHSQRPVQKDNEEQLVAKQQQKVKQQLREETTKKNNNMLLIRQLSESANEPSKQQMIEFERMNLEKTMTIKLDRKKETLKRKLKEFERRATAELVEKQSREMLALISMKLDEFKEEQKRKIGSDLDQFEAMEALANQLGPTLQLSALPKAGGDALKQQQQYAATGRTKVGADHYHRQAVATGASIEAPAPKPPQVSKMELYNSEEPDEVFRDIDQLAINVAREDQQSFTDLVHHLTRNCVTDIEKARAIFRWITVKNLNTMQFDSSVRPDTPLGILRGIKNGSESYHVLFKRLCSYAGLHCVVIKGYSKSAGYQPGVHFEGNRFKNSWNAVYVAGAWRFVQCNWGARHLVSVAVMQDKNQANGGKSTGGNPQPSRNPATSAGRLINHNHHLQQQRHAASPNHGRRGLSGLDHTGQFDSANNSNNNQQRHAMPTKCFLSAASPGGNLSTSSSSGHSSPSSSPSSRSNHHHHRASSQHAAASSSLSSANGSGKGAKNSNDSLRYEYDDHYFLTDPDEFIYEFFPLSPEWQLIKTRPITLTEFEQLPFVRSLFFKYGLYFPQQDIRSVLYTDSSGATTIKIGMPTHMIPSLIFHYNLKYYDSDLEQYEGVSLKRFVMQSVESGTTNDGQALLANVVSFRVHLPENGAYILDIFANSTTPNQYITGEPMKFKSVCKFKIIAKNLKTVMIPLPDCASGEFGPIKATRLFGIIPLTHESGLISVQNDKRFLEIQFRTTRPLLDFMASLHKNGYDERQLSKAIKIFVDGDIVIVTVKFFEDGQYGLDIYTRDQSASLSPSSQNMQLNTEIAQSEARNQLLTHCCKYLINVRTPSNCNNSNR